MISFWTITVLLFLIVTPIVVLFSFQYVKQQDSEMWKLWGTRIAYWEGVMVVSGILVFLVMVMLKVSDIMIF